MAVESLAAYAAGPRVRPGIALGFGSIDVEGIDTAVRRLAAAFAEAAATSA